MITDMRDELLVERYRTLLFEVSEAIATHRDLTALFRDLARRLPVVVPFEFIALFLHDTGRNVMRIHMLGNADADSIPPGMEIPVDGSFSGHVFTTQQPVIIGRLEEAERSPIAHSLMQQVGIASFCMLPLTTTLRRLGTIGFGSLRPDAFDSSEVEFLRHVATPVAVAVDNVLHDEAARTAQLQLTRERDQLGLLLEVSESIAAHRDLNDLFRDLAQRLPRIVPFDYINLVLYDAARHVMRLHLLAVPEETTFKPGMEFGVDESPGGLVWKTQQPLTVVDVVQDTRFPRLHAMLVDNGVQSYCAVPLTTALRRLGAMGFGSLQKRVYGESEIGFMQEVARQIAVAVDNVLHDESARSAQFQLARERDRYQLLLEVNNAVVSHLNMDDVFTSVSTSLQRVVQHDGCSLLLYEPETGHYRCHVLKVDKNESFVEEGQADHSVKSPGCIAMSTRAPAVFSETDLKTLWAESKVAQHLLAEGVKSFCSIPLLSHDKVLGTINVGRLREQVFTQEEVDLLSQVAQQIAIAVENGLAYRQIAELKEKLNEEKLYLEGEIRTEHNFEEIVGESPALREVLNQVEIVAPTDSTVLIQGETGTGKELIARAIHNLSGRRARTFVKLNCAAIPTGLLESELFGHEKGAFTGAIAQKIGRFELANGGTLFLDEVGDIPLELQSKFLRVLQEQEFERLGSTKTIRVDIRLVAATNRDLAAMISSKEFRSDLYYRLNVFPIMNPPLRDRPEDVVPLVHYFTRKFAKRMNRPITTIPSETMAVLSRYYWPGNIRELENFIERAVILSRGSSLAAPLSELKQRGRTTSSAAAVPTSTLEEAEREHIRQALEQANWLVGGPSGAAAKLGMKRTTLQSKMAKLRISRPPLHQNPAPLD
jgi:formate hydrogenlyase transcriptional activator